MSEDLQTLGEDLITTSARIVRWVPKDSESELSLSAARVMARLADGGPTRISDLAAAERCSQPTITNHVKRLEAMRLVSRTVDPTDGRAWMIKLTRRGQQQLTHMRHSLGSAAEPYLAQLSPQDRQALREGVAAMRRLMALDQD